MHRTFDWKDDAAPWREVAATFGAAVGLFVIASTVASEGGGVGRVATRLARRRTSVVS